MRKIKEFFKSKKENLNKSLRTKLFLIMTITIMAIVLALVLVNSIIVESYYLYYKKETILQSFYKINRYLTSNNISSSTAELELEKLAINNNLNILAILLYTILTKNSKNTYKDKKKLKRARYCIKLITHIL